MDLARGVRRGPPTRRPPLVSAAPTATAAPELLSQNRPVAASSTENGGTPATAAVDGNTGTRWSSAAADPQWISVDLGGSAAVSQVVLNWETAYAQSFQLQASADGSTWQAVSTHAGTPGTQTIATTTSTTTRHLRLYATARATQWGVSLWEIQVFGVRNPTNVVRVAEFLADCPFSHRRPDDPIVVPNLPGASHMHSFFGNRTTNAHSDVDSLLAGTSNCNPGVDLSSYWVPTLYADDQAVEPTITTFYYLGEGVRDDVIARIQPFPLGLRIVAGNSKATAPDATTLSRWSCCTPVTWARPRTSSTVHKGRCWSPTWTSRSAGTAATSTRRTTRATWPTRSTPTAGGPTPPPPQAPDPGTPLRLVWSDEFGTPAGTKPDGTKWRPEVIGLVLPDEDRTVHDPYFGRVVSGVLPVCWPPVRAGRCRSPTWTSTRRPARRWPWTTSWPAGRGGWRP